MCLYTFWMHSFSSDRSIFDPTEGAYDFHSSRILLRLVELWRCSSDLDCRPGGCFGEVCQSKYEEPVITICEWKSCYDAKRYHIDCGCIQHKCQWTYWE